MTTYAIRNIPAFVDYKGGDHPACSSLVLICSRGFRWEGGDFSTRAEAVAKGESLAQRGKAFKAKHG